MAWVVWSSVIMKMMFGCLVFSFFWLLQEARLSAAAKGKRMVEELWISIL